MISKSLNPALSNYQEITLAQFQLIKERLPFTEGIIHGTKVRITREQFNRCLSRRGESLENVIMDLFGLPLYEFFPDLKEYRISELLKDDFKHLPIGNIDFRRHLKSDVALEKNKRVYRDDKRPEYVEYFYEGVPYARIKFEFEADSQTNFISHRSEYLAYYYTDGSLGDYHLIKSKTFNAVADIDLIIEEREMARKQIVKDMKGLVVTVLGLADPTKPFIEHLLAGNALNRKIKDELTEFIENGIAKRIFPEDTNIYLVEKLEQDTDHAILNIKVKNILEAVDHDVLKLAHFSPDENTTLREALIALVTY